MEPRRRFLTAIDLGEPDRVPITDLCLDPPIIEAVSGRKLSSQSVLVVAGKNPQEESLATRRAMAEACLKLGFDAVSAVSDYAICGKDYRPRFLDGNRFIDEWGRIMEPRSDTKTTWWVGGTVGSEEEMRDYLPPDPEKGEGYQFVEKAVRSLDGSGVALMGQGHSGWHMAFQIRGGIDRLIIDMYRRPRVTKDFIRRVADTCRTMVSYMIEAGVEVIFITDDYADNRTTLISPDLFEEFELPNIQRIVRLAKRRGIPVLKHSDGNLAPIMDQMIAAGIDGIHPLEQGAMDLRQGKDLYGQELCILGNVDCRFVLPLGTEEDVRRDVRRCIDSAAPGGGYVLSSSNSLHANCLPENVLAMVREARKYGRYRTNGPAL